VKDWSTADGWSVAEPAGFDRSGHPLESIQEEFEAFSLLFGPGRKYCEDAPNVPSDAIAA
jgi:hypothetical protein